MLGFEGSEELVGIQLGQFGQSFDLAVLFFQILGDAEFFLGGAEFLPGFCEVFRIFRVF